MIETLTVRNRKRSIDHQFLGPSYMPVGGEIYIVQYGFMHLDTSQRFNQGDRLKVIGRTQNLSPSGNLLLDYGNVIVKSPDKTIAIWSIFELLIVGQDLALEVWNNHHD